MSEVWHAIIDLPSSLWVALRLTIALALVTSLLHIGLGLPLAHGLNNARFRGASWIETLVTLPIVLPPTVLGFYLLTLFAPESFLGSLWLRLTGDTLTFSFAGLVVGSFIYSLPYAVQPMQAALRAVPHACIEAAQNLGARPWRTFMRVQVPIASRGIMVGATLSFAHTIGEFGVVLMIGGSIAGRTRVASIALYDEVQKLNYAEAHAFALILLVLSFALLRVVHSLQRRPIALA
jgi:molybdate transport system permease protein